MNWLFSWFKTRPLSSTKKPENIPGNTLVLTSFDSGFSRFYKTLDIQNSVVFTHSDNVVLNGIVIKQKALADSQFESVRHYVSCLTIH